MKSLSATIVVALLALSSAAVQGKQGLDGATIINSGSTNTVGWSIAIRSDGRGTVTEEARGMEAEGATRAFSVSSDVTERFFTDIAAARDTDAIGRPCMKSVSFGTRLNVTWHRWTSPDLSCPPGSAVIATLVADVGRIVEAANPTSGMRRFIPVEPRRLPEQTPPPHRGPEPGPKAAGAQSFS